MSQYILTIPEELFMLTINSKKGRRAFLQSKKFDVLLSAAILMELALENRIDSDLIHIIPDRAEPTGHPMLDEALQEILLSAEPKKINSWIVNFAGKGTHFREMLVFELLETGLIRMEREYVFLGFSSAKYPILVQDKEVVEVKTRIRSLIFSNDLPDLRDVVIVSLAWYGGILDLILSSGEIEQYQSRIEQLASMDLIGQAVSKSMHEVTRSILSVMRTRELFGNRTPEEKLEDLVEELKALMHIEHDSDLPDWLRKGSVQYQKTLEYIRKTGTNEIVYNTLTGQYGLKAGAIIGKTF